MPKLTCPMCRRTTDISHHGLEMFSGKTIACPGCRTTLRMPYVPTPPKKVYEARPFRFGFGLGAGCLGGGLLALTVFWFLLYAGCAALVYNLPTPPEFQQWKSLEKSP